MKVHLLGVEPPILQLQTICYITKLCRATKKPMALRIECLKMSDEEAYEFVNKLISLDIPHSSILRFVHIVWIFENVSKVLTHQLVRHQVGIDFMQKSDRATAPGGVVIPPGLPSEAQDFAIEGMALYNKLVRDGYPKEDVRYILPVGSYTTIACIANLQSVRHLYRVRTDPHAQEEIRVAIDELEKKIRVQHPNVAKIIRGE